jgi:hypothetical protein
MSRRYRNAAKFGACLLRAFHYNRLRVGGSLSHFFRLPIFLRIPPIFRALHIFKFQYDKTLWLPTAFERFGAATAHNVFTAVGRDRRASLILYSS